MSTLHLGTWWTWHSDWLNLSLWNILGCTRVNMVWCLGIVNVKETTRSHWSPNHRLQFTSIQRQRFQFWLIDGNIDKWRSPILDLSMATLSTYCVAPAAFTYPPPWQHFWSTSFIVCQKLLFIALLEWERLSTMSCVSHDSSWPNHQVSRTLHRIWTTDTHAWNLPLHFFYIPATTTSPPKICTFTDYSVECRLSRAHFAGGCRVHKTAKSELGLS